MDFFLIWVFPALLLGGIGLLLFLSTSRHIKRCKQVSAWSQTQAVIEKASVESHSTWRRVAGSSASYRRLRYEPKIDYSYNVLGTTYHASGYQNFTGVYASSTEEEASRIVEAYPVGKEVTITYDPNNPSDAYLLPQTSTDKLVKSRKGQIVIIAIALVWVGIGAVLNLTSILGEKASDARINKSAGLVPYTAQEINLKLDPLVKKYKLNCEEETTAGNKLAYSSRACRAASGSDLTSFEVFARKNSPETVDMISAVFTPSNQQKTITFFIEAASLVFEGDNLKAAETLITDGVARVTAGGGTGVTAIAGINLALDNLGGTLRLNIGDLQ